MAPLPPKIPGVSSEWPPAFPYQRAPYAGALFSGTAAMQQTSWVDEFLDFSSVKRSGHRRSASDSIAFIEVEECRSSSTGGMRPEFDRLDDEQLMSMFSDDIAPGAAAPLVVAATMSTSSPSSPSDHNSINDDKPAPSSCEQQQPQRNETEVQSACESDAPVLAPTTTPGDPIIDPKRVKRILANRQSAQRSRVRKLQYISELERSVTSLQTEVSALSPRVAFLDHQRLVLNVDNSALKQRIAALAQDKIFKDAHQEALKKEIDRLRRVYHQQGVKKIQTAQLQQQQQEKPQICSNGDEHQLLN